MDLSAIRNYGPRAFFALLALAAAPTTMQATLLTAVSPIAVTCNTATGPAAATNFTLKATATPSASTPEAITFTAVGGGALPTWLTITPLVGGATNLTSLNNLAGIGFGVAITPGCAGASTGAQIIQVKQNATVDITITVNATVTSAASALTASNVTLTCTRIDHGINPATYSPGPAQTVSVTSAATGGTPFVIDSSATAAWATVGVASAASASATASTFTVTASAGCNALSVGASATTTINLTSSPAPVKSITVSLQVSAPGPSPLTVTNLTFTCVRTDNGLNPATYAPGPAQAVSVTSAANGGTAFTIDNITNIPPSWISVGAPSGANATAIPVTFSVTPSAGCNAQAAGTNIIGQIHLLNAPNFDKLVTITLATVAPTPLTATPTPATLSYVKGSGSAGRVDVAITSSIPNAFFAVDTSTLPSWLIVDSVTGSAPKSIRFTSNNVADSLAPGTYSANIHLKVSNRGDLVVPISILVTNTAPKLTLAEGTTRNLSWVLGTSIPTPVITAVSSDSPIPYTVTTGGTLGPTVPAAQLKGLAYSFGSQIPVSFSSLAFATAQPGQTLTGTVTITWGSQNSVVVVTFNIAVQSPGATLTSISPASLPIAASGTYTVTISGTGFIPGTDLTQRTKVGVVTVGNVVTPDTYIQVAISDSSHMVLTIAVPSSVDANLPFGIGGNVTLGICNPIGGVCTTPTGTALLTIGSNPIVQAVTNSAAFTQVTPPALQTVAPYDIISIFGSNFCSSSGSGCSSSQILYGTPDPVSGRYPLSLSPDNSGVTQRNLTVTFQTSGVSPTVLASAAPLLFATNNQINLMVPDAVKSQIASTVDVVVNFGYGSGLTMKSSAPLTLNVSATDPGIFTVGADGQGDGAILNSAWAVVNVGNPAGMRSTTGDSDTVQLYMTGLGVPDSIADNSAAGIGPNPVWDTDCTSISTFLASLNSLTGASQALTSLDGALIQSAALNTNRLVPCLLQTGTDVPTVSIGGQPATVLYAGFVPDTIAGLYQINVTLPPSSGSFTLPNGSTLNSLTAAVALPVSITAHSRSSQPGVTLWVAPRLKVVAPANGALSGTVGIPWTNTSNSVVATEGTATYSYSLTSGLLPAGLSLTSTGALVGTPSASTSGTYLVTVTATDSAPIPLIGTVSFTVMVDGGLVLSAGTPILGVFGTGSTLATMVATGGAIPYTYSITAPVSLPTGMSINPTSGAIAITNAAPAGTYHITAHAVDSFGVHGDATFDLVVGLLMAETAPSTGTAGQINSITTVSATGNTGTLSFAFTGTQPPAWVVLNSSTGAITTTNSAATLNSSYTLTATDSAPPTGGSAAGTGTISVLIHVL